MVWMSHSKSLPFVFGVDLDGVCGDYTGALKPIAAELLGVDPSTLTDTPSYDYPEWFPSAQSQGQGEHESIYFQIHRFAVTQRELFKTMLPISGSVSVLRRLSNRGVTIRIVTKRLIVPNFHQTAVQQTVSWLDHYGFPYSDLCFLGEKHSLGCDLYIDDSPANVHTLRAAGMPTIVYRTSQNCNVTVGPIATNWSEVEELVLREHERKMRSSTI